MGGKEAAYARAKKRFWSSRPALKQCWTATRHHWCPICRRNPCRSKSLCPTSRVRSWCGRLPTVPVACCATSTKWRRGCVMTDKTSGEDRSAWVVSYESEHYEMDRVGAGSIHCDNLAVSIYGNIQPQVFRQNVAALSADGLLQRFIPAVLHGRKTKLGNPIPECMTSAAAWETTLRLIYALPPQVYRLSTEAFDEFREFQRWYEDAKQDERVLDSGPEYMTAFGKLEGLAGRLILLTHIIESPFSPTVNADVVRRMVSMIRGYVIPAYRYALGEVGGTIANSFDQWMIDHIIQISGDTRIIDLRTLKNQHVARSTGKRTGRKIRRSWTQCWCWNKQDGWCRWRTNSTKSG